MTTPAPFPSIRELAEKTDQLPEDDDRAVEETADDGPAPIEEVESMCMVCGGNVRPVNICSDDDDINVYYRA